MDTLSGRPEVAEVESRLAAEFLEGDGWRPTWACICRAGDDLRYARHASAVGTKATARYRFVEPTPFAR